MTYDVIVLGLGGMGSAAAAHLAARGQRVLGLERFGPAHDRGSSHGDSRIIRQSYFEDPAYVPLLLRGYELWDQLARDSGSEVIRRTGGLYFGPPSSGVGRKRDVSSPVCSRPRSKPARLHAIAKRFSISAAKTPSPRMRVPNAES